MKMILALIASMILASSVKATTIQSQDLPNNLVLSGTFTAAGFQSSVNGFTLPDGTKLTSTATFVSSQSSYTAGGDLSGSGSNPTVVKVNGVTFTGVPTVGQAPIATSATNATWQNISGGSGLPTTGGTMTGDILMSGLKKIDFSTSTTATPNQASIGFSTNPIGRLEINVPDTGAGLGVLQLTSASEGFAIILSTQSNPDLNDIAIIQYSTRNGLNFSSGNGSGELKLTDNSAMLETGNNRVETTATEVHVEGPKLNVISSEIYLNPSGRLYVDATNFISSGTGTHIGESSAGYLDLSGAEARLGHDGGTTKFVANTSSANITGTDVNILGNTTIFGNLELGNVTTIHFGGTTNRTLCVNTSGNIFSTPGPCP